MGNLKYHLVIFYVPHTYESELIKLECELISYMSVLDISDDYNDY